MEIAIDLDELQDGRFMPDLQAKLRDALAEAYNYQAKVGVVVTFTLTPKTIGPDQSEAVVVEAKVDVKHHKEPGQATSLFIWKGKDGSVSASRKHPEQTSLFEKKGAEVRVLRD